MPLPEVAGVPSPVDGEVFHPGERLLQAHFGVRTRVAENGVRAIQPALATPHQTFLQTLRYVLLAACDAQGWPWASVLLGQAGFVDAPDASTLHIRARPREDDPLLPALVSGAAVGMLGIDLAARRRIRVNGRLALGGPQGMVLAVSQAYNNCPQYIWPRADGAGAPSHGAAGAGPTEESAVLPAAIATTVEDQAVRALLARADTFFIASSYQARDDDPARVASGVDVSHRGGRPGFLTLAHGRLSWPEYTGNAYFNTLGNLLVDGRCALLVPDFETGAVLQLQGLVTLDLSPPPAAPAQAGLDEGLRRNAVVHLAPRQAVLRPGVLPPDWLLLDRASTRDTTL